jgi:hypothetical protein
MSGEVTLHQTAKLIHWLEQRAQTTVIFFIFCGGALLVFSHLDAYRYVILSLWTGFLASGAILVVLLGDFCRLRWWRLRYLAGDEKKVLAAFIKQDLSTIPWTISMPEPKSLAAEGMVFKSPHTEDIDKGYIYYTLKPWIFRYLKDNKTLIGL